MFFREVIKTCPHKPIEFTNISCRVGFPLCCVHRGVMNAVFSWTIINAALQKSLFTIPNLDKGTIGSATVNSSEIERIEALAQMLCAHDPEDPSLFTHVQLVRKFALELARIEGANPDVCEVAALLHDVGKSKEREDHHITGRDLAEEFLRSVDLPEEKKALFLKCIFYHRSRFSSEDHELDAKVIQSADCLGALFNDRWQEHCRKTLPEDVLRKFYEEGALRQMNLESAREIARPRLRRLLKKLDMKEKAISVLENPHPAQLFIIDEQKVHLQFDSSGYVLDIGGGGEGVVGRWKGEKVVAIDVRKEELEEAPEGPLKIVMDAANLQFLDCTFETVTAFFTLMYIHKSSCEKVMHEVFRVLKPRGQFLIWDVTIPSRGESSKEYFVVPVIIVVGEKEIKTAYGVRWEDRVQNLQYYVEMAERIGFEAVEKKEQGNTFYLSLQKK